MKRAVDSLVLVTGMGVPLLIVVMTVTNCWTEVDTRAEVLTTGVVITVVLGAAVEAGAIPSTIVTRTHETMTHRIEVGC